MADLEALKQAVIFGKRKRAMDITQQAISEGMDPEFIINSCSDPCPGRGGQPIREEGDLRS